MAPPVGDSAQSPLRLAIEALAAPSWARLAFALRLTLVCAVTTVVVETFQTPEAALTVYVAFFVNRPDRTSTVLLAVVTMIAITVIVGGLVPLSGLVVDDPGSRLLAMVTLSFAFVFLGSASKLRPVSATFALVTGYALDLLGSTPGGEVVTRALLYILLFVGIPVLVSIAAGMLLGPSPRRLAERRLAGALGATAELLEAPSCETRNRLAAMRAEIASTPAALLHLAAIERTSAPADVAALRRAAQSTYTIMSAVALIDGCFRAAIPAPTLSYFAADLRSMGAILAKGGYPVQITPAALDPDAIGSEAEPVLAALIHAMSGFTEPATNSSDHAKTSDRRGFFAADAFSNPVHVRHALKTTAAAMTCYLLFQVWNWPGIHTAMITCYIVALGTAAETVEKLALRIAGGAVGAALGLAAIVFILPGVTTLGGLMAVVTGGMLVATWVAAGSPRIAYAGFQIAFAFLLCVLQGSGPGFDLSIARDRVLGIFLGDLVTYFVFTRFWPVSVGSRIDASLSSLLRLLAELVTAPAEARPTIAMGARVCHANLQQDLALARFEPEPVRPAPGWLETRLRILNRADAVEAPLLFEPSSPASGAGTAKRLLRMADRIDGGRLQAEPHDEGEPGLGAGPRGLTRRAIDALDHLIEGNGRHGSRSPLASA